MLTMGDVEFEVRVEPEYMPFVGNCCAIDEDTDRETEEWIRSELESGNELAWCSVLVTARATVDGVEYEGTDSLCCVSCADQKSFEEYPLAEMKRNAVAELESVIEEARKVHFTLSIELGKDTMQTTVDVARALRVLAAKLDTSEYVATMRLGGTVYVATMRFGGTVHDDNGNRVGEWHVKNNRSAL